MAVREMCSLLLEHINLIHKQSGMETDKVRLSDIPFPTSGNSIVTFAADDLSSPRKRPDLSGVTMKWLTSVAVMDSNARYGPPYIFHFANIIALGPLSLDDVQRVLSRSKIISEIIGTDYSYCQLNILATVLDIAKNNFIIYPGIYSNQVVTFKNAKTKEFEYRYLAGREGVISLSSFLYSYPSSSREYNQFKNGHAMWLLEQCCLWYILDIDNVNLSSILVAVAQESSPFLLNISGVREGNIQRQVQNPSQNFYFNVLPSGKAESSWGEAVISFYARVKSRVAGFNFNNFAAIADIRKLENRRERCVAYLYYHSISHERSATSGHSVSLEDIGNIFNRSLVIKEMELRMLEKPPPITIVQVSTLEDIIKRSERRAPVPQPKPSRVFKGPQGGMVENGKYTYSLGNRISISGLSSPESVFNVAFMRNALTYLIFRSDEERARMVVMEIYRLNEYSDNLLVVMARLCASIDSAVISCIQGINNDLTQTVLRTTNSWKENIEYASGSGFFEDMAPVKDVLDIVTTCSRSEKSKDFHHTWTLYYDFSDRLNEYSIQDLLTEEYIASPDILRDEIAADLLIKGEEYFNPHDAEEHVMLGSIFFALLTERSLTCIQILRMYKDFSDKVIDGKKVTIMTRNGADYDPVRVILQMISDIVGPSSDVVTKRYMNAKKQFPKLAIGLLSYPIISFVMNVPMGISTPILDTVTQELSNALTIGSYDLIFTEDEVQDIRILNNLDVTPEEYTRSHPLEYSEKVLENVFDDVSYEDILINILGNK